MRKITITMDDAGRVEVEFLVDPENNRFFTKRDFDRIVRSMKQKYRRSIREYRKNTIIRKFKEQENGIKHEQQGNEDERKREESRIDSIGTTEHALKGAVSQALKRSGKLNLAKGG